MRRRCRTGASCCATSCPTSSARCGDNGLHHPTHDHRGGSPRVPGIGLRPTTDPEAYFISSWGTLLLEGQAAINTQPWLLLGAAICVALVVMAFTFLGDGLRDALDPRMKR
jgi:hypothetical protein